MNILSLGLDQSILNPDSSLAKRVKVYGDLVNSYTVIVPAENDKQVELGENIFAYGVSGNNKISKLKKIKEKAEKLLQEKEVDVISIQDIYFLGLLGVKLARKYNLGLEIQIHGFEKYNFVRKGIARYVVKRADSVRVVSMRLVDLLVKKFKVDPLKITQVPIYVDCQSLQNKEVDFDLHKKYDADFIFVSAQRLAPVKNVELQLKAMAKIKEDNIDKKIKLIIVGDGELKNDLVKLSEKLNITDNVKFVGWQDNLASYYKGADALLISSKAEGWGMTAVESLACGTPVIMTNVGLAGEVVINNINGLVVPVGDEDRFIQAMKEFINNKMLRKRLIQGASEEIKNILTRQETLDKYKLSWDKAKKFVKYIK